MEQLIVGEGELALLMIDKILRRSPSCAELLPKWKSFARYLSVNEASLPGLERQINLNTIPFEDTPLEVMRIWKTETGSTATLKKLSDALKDCEVLDIAELLEANFCPPVLSKGHQNKLMQILKHEVLPERPPNFYITRNFQYKNELDKKAFTSDKTRDHVFLFKGISKPDLIRVVDFRPIDFSGNQLRKVTMQYIVMELDEDYETICSITTKPVHLIQYKDGSLFWIKSSQKLSLIREFIKDDQGKNFDEDGMIKRIESNPPPCSMSIADSPGMGKTTVLANLAFKIMSRNTNAVVIFLALQEFMQKLERIKMPAQSTEAISYYATASTESKQMLQEMFKDASQLFYLFLDGYDEILETKLGVADSFLTNLKCLTNVKVILSTRPHMKSRLEDVFSQLSFEILPFTEKDQIEFLTRYWTSKHEAKENDMLKKFGSQCLKSLENDMIDQGREIAGIPLQCWMLAEVFAKDAKRASQLKSLRDDMIKLTSFFEMYKSLINLKFSKIPEHAKEKYMNAHVNASMTSLFPEWIEKFELCLDGHKDIDENIMYAIGLVEKSPNTKKPRFLHRTFAEYILAGFIVNGLCKFSVCIEFLYKELFGEKGTDKLVDEHAIDRYRLKCPVIGYFIDAQAQANYIDDSLLLKNVVKANLNDEDVCIAAYTCCCHNLVNVFDLTAKILRECNIKINEDLRDGYFKHLPFAAASVSKNVSLYEKVMQFTRQEFGVDLSYHVYLDKANNIECTPLHFALLHWNYNVVIYLLKEYENEIRGMSGLLHWCVVDSATNSESVIVEKLATIDLLLHLNPEWLNESIIGCVTILLGNIHVKLLQRLVERSTDINTYSSQYGTILHATTAKGTQDNSRDVVRWALNNGFNLINERSEYGPICLIIAIYYLKEVDDEVLQWFHQVAGDFNAKDVYSDSVLHYAIRCSNNTDFVRKLIDYGGDVTHVNNGKETLAHYTIRYVKDPDLALSLLKLLVLKGFRKFDQRNRGNLTPVELAKKMRSGDVELIDYLNNFYKSSKCSVQK